MEVSPEESREAELRASCAIMALSLPIVSPAAAQPDDRVIGLLAFRQLDGALCEQPPPGEVALYATPNRLSRSARSALTGTLYPIATATE